MSDRLLTCREVAERWALSPATVVDYVERGSLPAIRLGGTARGRIRIRLADVEEVERAWTREPRGV
jgi:excisionase family DNA binding protein